MNELRRAAIVALATHAFAGAAMALVLRNGLETNPDLQSRIAFVVNHRVLWTMGWFSWTAAAIAILYFYAAFDRVHGKGDPTIFRVAVLLTAAAIAPDLVAQTIEIGVLPVLASERDGGRFVLIHRMAVLMSGYVANSLYSLSALILAWCSRKAYPVWVWSAGLTVAFSGFALSAAVLGDSAGGMFWTNVVLVPSILLWLTGIAVIHPKLTT